MQYVTVKINCMSSLVPMDMIEYKSKDVVFTGM